MPECVNCGRELRARATVCPECGQRTLQPLPSFNDKRGFGRNKAPKGNSRVRLYSTIAAVALAVIVVGIVATVVVTQTQQAERAAAAALAPRTATISFSIPELEAQTSSLIPLRVHGKDFRGVLVDETVYVAAVNGSFEIRQGSYTLTLLASPLSANGNFYRPVVAESQLEVAELGVRIDWASPSFELVPSEAVTDEELENACTYARAAGWNAEQVAAAREATAARRAQAQQAIAEAQQAEAEAARAAAAAEAAKREAELTIDTQYFSIVLPPAYQGRYNTNVAENQKNWGAGVNEVLLVASITTDDPVLNFEVGVLRANDKGVVSGMPASSVYSVKEVGTLSSDPTAHVIVIRYREFEEGVDPGKLAMFASYVKVK